MREKLEAFITMQLAEIARLEGELAKARRQGSVVDATGVAIAIGIREESVRSIKAILKES